MIIGFMLFFVMRAMGELLLSNLEYKSFSDFAADLLGPWAGFFTGWTYWFCWVVTGIADVVAITTYAQFWFPELSQWIASLLCVLLLLGLNLGDGEDVRRNGVLVCDDQNHRHRRADRRRAGDDRHAVQSPTGTVASFTHLWNDGGMFPKGISGFFAGFQIAVFAFVGIELVGATAAETRIGEIAAARHQLDSDPHHHVLRVLLIVIMSVTPWNSVVPDKSPFVELFVLVGLPAAASVINFVVLTSAASSANSGVFSTSRMLFGLAQEGDAPKSFANLSKRAVPANGLTFSCICLLGGVVLIYLIPNVMTVFTR